MKIFVVIEYKTIFILVLLAVGICCIGSAEAYPWIHYFQRPDMPRIHCAFADSEGNVLVSTGDWDNTRAGPSGYYWREYWSEGIFRINEDAIEPISCPEDTYIVDFATDHLGRTWALASIGRDYLVEMSMVDPLGKPRCTASPARLQARAGCADTRSVDSPLYLGYLDGAALVEYPGLIDRIPHANYSMASDRQGRLFVLGGSQVGWYFYQYAISWWDANEPIEIHTLDLSEIIPQAVMAGRFPQYPKFGPDGSVYIATNHVSDEEIKRCNVLCLNPDTEEWELFSGQDNPLLDSQLEYFYVDEMNRRWFGMEDGLVLFDGENWARFTTQNSAIPYDRVIEVDFDRVADCYYILCREAGSTGPGGWPRRALTILDASGRFSDCPFHFEGLWVHSPGDHIFSDSRGVWWFQHIAESSIVYSWDHREVMIWDTRDWIEDSWGGDYIGSTANGRNFCVESKWIMIW